MEGTAAVLIRTEDPETVFWSWKLEASGSPAPPAARGAARTRRNEEKKARTSTPRKTKREMAECHHDERCFFPIPPKSKLKPVTPPT